MSEVVVGRDDDSVRVTPGDVVVVRLPETSTAGYQWQLSAVDPALLDVESTLRPPDSQAPGAAGAREFRLRTSKPAQVRVEFALGRAWESEPEERHVLMITVT